MFCPAGWRLPKGLTENGGKSYLKKAIFGEWNPRKLPFLGILLLPNTKLLVNKHKKFYNDNIYFWRNTDQQEVDFVVERDGEMSVYEIKYNANKTAKLPKSFEEAYHPKKFMVVNCENYLTI